MYFEQNTDELIVVVRKNMWTKQKEVWTQRVSRFVVCRKICGCISVIPHETTLVASLDSQQ